MKNLFLAALFFALVGVAWLLEGNQEESLGEYSGDDFIPVVQIKQEDLARLELPNAAIERSSQGNREEFLLSSLSYPASEDKVALLLKRLNTLGVVRELEDVSDTSQYFAAQDHSIKIETKQGERLRLRVGDVSQVTGNFFAQVSSAAGEKMLVVKDLSFFEGFYQSEVEANVRRYTEFMDLVLAGPFAFSDRQVFSEESLAGLEKIRIDNQYNRWFELDLVQGTTVPAPPAGLKAMASPEYVLGLLRGLQFERFDPIQGEMGEALSEVSFHYAGQNQNIVAKIFGEFQGQQGLFLRLSNQEERVYTLNESAKSFFFASLQSFWDKRPSVGKDLKDVKSFEFSMGSTAGGMTAFRVPDAQKFEVVPLDNGVQIIDSGYFNIVFNALWAKNGLEQAYMASGLSESELERRLGGLRNKLRVEAFGKVFVFSIENSEMVLLDLIERLEFRYAIDGAVDKFTPEKIFSLESAAVQG